MTRDAMLGVFEQPLYDANAVRELFMSVGPPDEAAALAEPVAFELSEIGKSFGFERWREAQAATPEREKRARLLAAACQKVLETAGVANGGELLPALGQGGLFMAASLRGEPRGEAATMNAIHAVNTLRQDALKVLEVMTKRRRMKTPKKGRPEVLSAQRLVRDLSCLYERVWRRTPGTSLGDKAEPCGPFMRLMLDVVGRLRERGVRVASSPDSLRAVWRRLPDEEKMPESDLLRRAGLFNEATGSLSK